MPSGFEYYHSLENQDSPSFHSAPSEARDDYITPCADSHQQSTAFIPIQQPARSSLEHTSPFAAPNEPFPVLLNTFDEQYAMLDGIAQQLDIDPKAKDGPHCQQANLDFFNNVVGAQPQDDIVSTDLASLPGSPALDAGAWYPYPLGQGMIFTSFTGPSTHHTRCRANAARRDFVDEFVGAPEPLLTESEIMAVPVPVYSSQWTDLEDSCLRNSRNQCTGVAWPQFKELWDQAYVLPGAAGLKPGCRLPSGNPTFPMRDVSDIIARWKFLEQCNEMSDHCKMTNWVLRNCSIPEDWMDIQTLISCMRDDGLLFDITVLDEVEKSWAKLLCVNGVRYPFPKTCLRPEAEMEYQETMKMLEKREIELIKVMYGENGMDLTQIASHYQSFGMMWFDDTISSLLANDEIDDWVPPSGPQRLSLIGGQVRRMS